MKVIEVHWVSVRYREKNFHSLKKAVGLFGAHRDSRYFYALHDVSLT